MNQLLERNLMVGQEDEAQPQVVPQEADGLVPHHILFHEEEWSSFDAAKTLRDHPGLVVAIAPNTREAIYADAELCDGVPLLGRKMAKKVLSNLLNYEIIEGEPVDINSLIRILEVESSGIDYAKTQRELGKLTLGCLQRQRQYLTASQSH